MRSIVSQRSMLATGCALAAIALSAPAVAQDEATQPAATPTGASLPRTDADGSTSTRGNGAIIVTGSRIRQDPNRSALPLQIITTDDLSREGISNPEQLISYLSTNGNGSDNLASNTDVTSGAQRGTNGLSAANLRGQGAASTLVLLNGRRVAAHGLTGSAVDVNQIPFAAIDRVEVLKDGASAIYGTDAIGGVINFITKTNFQGVILSGFTDITDEGDSPIYRLTGTVGYGDLDDQRFNVMASVSKSWSGILRGNDRDFVNGNQPNRGLSVDTRGTPIATAFNVAGNANQVVAANGSLLQGLTLTAPNGANAAAGGINVLDLPGGAGCDSFDGGMPYDEVLWANPTAVYACAYDTGRAAILQQPLETFTYYGRATAALGDHRIFAEVTGSDADSAKQFSENQYSTSTSTTASLPIYYPLNALTTSTYNSVFNSIRAAFPNAAQQTALDARYGRPIAFRFRCIDCGPREYRTTTTTLRGTLGVEGPIGQSWDYRAGGSYARSESNSILGSGYSFTGVFRGTVTGANGAVIGLPGQNDPRAPTAPGASGPGIVGLFNSGILNPFTLTQTAAALAALEAVSAEGTVLYGGKYEVYQADASVSGRLFALPGGDVQVALGVDYRRETYSFNGSDADSIANTPNIFNAAFDNANALEPKSRTVKAAYAELLVPVFDMLTLTAAARIDDYTGFGSTFNPKFTAKFEPFDWLLFRASYNTGFRVPTFNQIFNGNTISPNPGNARVDPTTCPSGVVSTTVPGCAAITPDTVNGGNPTVGPETSEQYSVGVVIRPTPRWSLSADYWSIAVDDTITSLTLNQALANITLLDQARFVRTNGILTLIDLRAGNFGSRRTKGIEFSARGGFDAAGGAFDLGLDGTWLLEKKENLVAGQPFQDVRGVFTYTGDLGLEWKHNAWVTFSRDDFAVTFSQIYRGGYANNGLPSLTNNVSATRPDYNERVEPYIVYNFSVSQRIAERLKLTAGVRNVFDTDPPFAITYDSNTGAGSSWEPRVADPRGRSFTLLAEVKF
jgi:iron complex outermembrane receptor protein